MLGNHKDGGHTIRNVNKVKSLLFEILLKCLKISSKTGVQKERNIHYQWYEWIKKHHYRSYRYYKDTINHFASINKTN